MVFKSTDGRVLRQQNYQRVGRDPLAASHHTKEKKKLTVHLLLTLTLKVSEHTKSSSCTFLYPIKTKEGNVYYLNQARKARPTFFPKKCFLDVHKFCIKLFHLYIFFYIILKMHKNALCLLTIEKKTCLKNNL